MTDTPDHLRGPEWRGWDAVFQPADIKFENREMEMASWQAVTINGRDVMSIEDRPHYCDRGRFMVRCDLPDIDNSDGFPRYYQNEVPMRMEIVAWLNWRLWRRRVS